MAKSQPEFAADFLEELVSCQNPQQNLSYSMQLKRMEYMLDKAAAERASGLSNGVKSAQDTFGVKSEGASHPDKCTSVKSGATHRPGPDEIKYAESCPDDDGKKYGASHRVDGKTKPASTRRPDEIKYAVSSRPDNCSVKSEVVGRRFVDVENKPAGSHQKYGASDPVEEGKKYGATASCPGDVKTKTKTASTRRPDEIKYAVGQPDNFGVKSEVEGRRVDVENKAAAIRRPDDGKKYGATASHRADVETKPASTRRPDEIKYAVGRPDNYVKSEVTSRRVDVKSKSGTPHRPVYVETNKPAASLGPDDGQKYTPSRSEEEAEEFIALCLDVGNKPAATRRPDEKKYASRGLFFPDDNSGVKSSDVADRPVPFKIKAATRVSRPDDAANPFDDQIKPKPAKAATRRPDEKKYTVGRRDNSGVKSEVAAGRPVVDDENKPTSRVARQGPEDGKKSTPSRSDEEAEEFIAYCLDVGIKPEPAPSLCSDDRKKLTASRERKQYGSVSAASYSEDGEIKSKSAASLRDQAQNPHPSAFVPYVKIRASKALEALGDSKRYRARLEKKIKIVKDEIKGMDGELDKHRFKYDGLNCILKIGIDSLLEDIQGLDSNVFYLNREIEKEKRRNEMLEKIKLDKKKEELEKIKVDDSQAQFIKDLAKSSFLSSFLSHQAN